MNANVEVVGFCGVIGSGKDHRSKELVSKGYTKVAFADPLKKLCYDAVGWKFDEKNTYLSDVFKENHWNPIFKKVQPFSGRELLERVGQSLQESFGSDFWCRAWEHSVLTKELQKVTVSDVRYKVEVRTLLKYNTTLYFCDYRSHRYTLRNTAPEQLAQHLRSVGFKDGDNVTEYLRDYAST